MRSFLEAVSLVACLLPALPQDGARSRGPDVLSPPEAAPLVTAVGDVHGDFKTFQALLRSVGLIDSADHWCGGARHLVQTGDLVDRGEGSREVLELLMRIEEEARAVGGQVVVTLGNHEVMNMTGDFAYTTKGEMIAFEKDEKPQDRAKLRARILELVKKGSPLLRSSYYRELSRVLNEGTFDLYFWPGYFAHLDAYSPMGRYGRWLLERPAIHKEAKTLFLHGGLSPRYGALTLEQINTRVKAAIRLYLEGVSALEDLGAFDRALGASELWLLVRSESERGPVHPVLAGALTKIEEAWNSIAFDPEGPLWYRGLALGDRDTLKPFVSRMLSLHGADRMVIGHTQPQSLTMEGRFKNQVILIDTGMNQAVYKGRPSALFILKDGSIQVWD